MSSGSGYLPARWNGPCKILRVVFWGVMVISPQWSKISPGETIDVVVKSAALGLSNGTNLVQTLDKSLQWILISGDLGAPSDQYVCLGLSVVSVGKRVVAQLTDESIVRPLGPPVADSYAKVVELCSGLGAWSSICGEVGLQSVAGVDQNARWGPLFGSLHPGSHFLTGDIADRKVLCDLVDLGAARALILAGVACQPYSRAGDRKGLEDSRAVSLPRALLAGCFSRQQSS